MCKLVSDISNIIDWMDGAKVKSYHKKLWEKDIKIIYNKEDDDYLLVINDENSIFISEGMTEGYKRELIEEVTNCRKTA